MSLQIKIDPINRDIELMLSEMLSPQAQSATIAQFASEQIDAAEKANAQALGEPPAYTVSVDGTTGAALETVKPGGTIIAEFDLFPDVLSWISDQLELHSPVGSGRDTHPGLYQKSHRLFADGQQIDVLATIPAATEFAFVNIVPYARKIETGESSQAPDGVYQTVASLAQRRFGNIAKITFAYRTAISDSIVRGKAGNRSSDRNPAIIVTLRG